ARPSQPPPSPTAGPAGGGRLFCPALRNGSWMGRAVDPRQALYGIQMMQQIVGKLSENASGRALLRVDVLAAVNEIVEEESLLPDGPFDRENFRDLLQQGACLELLFRFARGEEELLMSSETLRFALRQAKPYLNADEEPLLWVRERSPLGPTLGITLRRFPEVVDREFCREFRSVPGFSELISSRLHDLIEVEWSVTKDSETEGGAEIESRSQLLSELATVSPRQIVTSSTCREAIKHALRYGEPCILDGSVRKKLYLFFVQQPQHFPLRESMMHEEIREARRELASVIEETLEEGGLKKAHRVALLEFYATLESFSRRIYPIIESLIENRRSGGELFFGGIVAQMPDPPLALVRTILDERLYPTSDAKKSPGDLIPSLRQRHNGARYGVNVVPYSVIGSKLVDQLDTRGDVTDSSRLERIFADVERRSLHPKVLQAIQRISERSVDPHPDPFLDLFAREEYAWTQQATLLDFLIQSAAPLHRVQQRFVVRAATRERSEVAARVRRVLEVCSTDPADAPVEEFLRLQN
ncbi:hypothetical protein MRY87_00055, partial [bacterium]|nr:hypothetical protein [bacterium]